MKLKTPLKTLAVLAVFGLCLAFVKCAQDWANSMSYDETRNNVISRLER